MFAGPVVGAAAIGAAGSLGAGVMDMMGAKSANKHNRASAREQMAFQERTSSTAHQREVKDLIDAGLNPLLSVNHGASSPSGSQSVSQNEMSGAAHHVSRSAASASEAIRMKAEVEKIKADTALSNVLARQNEAKIFNDAMTSASTVRYQNALGDQADSSTLLNAITGRSVSQGMTLRAPKADLYSAMHHFTSDLSSQVKKIPQFSKLVRDSWAGSSRAGRAVSEGVRSGYRNVVRGYRSGLKEYGF